MSKGSTKRPGDDAAYRDNWERIFRNTGDHVIGVVSSDGEVVGKLEISSPKLTGKYTMPNQTCGNCKHWLDNGDETPARRESCTNLNVLDMADLGRFEPHAGFSCSLWEAKI